MCRKFVLLVSVALVLGIVGNASAAIPAGWQNQDIGTTGGSASESNGTWTVSGDGADVWGTSDAFHYAYVPLIGNGEITARVVSNGTGSNTWAKGGVMIRETLDANSKHMIMALTGSEGGGIAFQGRFQSAGANSSSLHGTVTASPPHWVKMTRQGNTITGYHSADGVTWTLFAGGADNAGGTITNPIDVTMATNVYIGLFITSHAAGEIRTFTFDNVTVGLPVMAYMPSPADGSIYPDTWASMSWKVGHTAVSHDVYFGENAADVEAGTADTFQGNQASPYFVVGFPGFPYPDGLVNGTTYYWRVDEVEADGVTKYTGYVWSFTVPPKTAYSPLPADGTEFVELNTQLKWTGGFGAKLHYVVFGEDFDEVSNAAMGIPNGTTTYNPGPLQLAKTYYWRIDEFDGAATLKGDVWSFTTLGAVSGPNPADGAVDVKPSVILKWDAGAVAASHEVYFGADADAVKNATKSSPEYKGPKALGEESYEPGELMLNTAYYWRIDEVNGASTDSPWAGNVWSFTTGDFFVIDDFEDYDSVDNQIWYAWHDGLGYGAPGTPDFFGGNGTGAAVGDETTPSYTEETIVHGGSQSMPISYDNNKQGLAKYSEVEHTLTNQRDWTEEGVANLSLWFRGYPASTGSFVEGPAGTFTMTGSGADIWAVNGVEADEFHFAYKMLNGAGSITAKVVSLDNTDPWAKAGVMIRESLNPDSAHAFACITPGNGVAMQFRPSTGGTSVNYNQAGVAAPYWVKLERSISGNFTVSHSSNGTTWQPVTGATVENVPMGTNVYIGLAVTAHNAALTCQAVFSNVTTTGNITGQWAHQDIGILSNDAEPLYVAVSNSTGNPAVVVNDDPAAAQIDTWTEWVIPLQAFADQGIVLTNVDRIAIGLGTRGNMTIPGGSGKIFIDDIRLLKPAPEPEPEPEPEPQPEPQP
jgi:hypothetical protein